MAVAEGGIRETIVDGVNGLLVDADPEAMASAIRQLLKDTNQARALGEAGVRLVNERWSLAAVRKAPGRAPGKSLVFFTTLIELPVI